jgi:Spy/CpxP family protein refolding chaperone
MITINLTKAKDIAHEKRRAARTTEFAPLDIKATIPSEAAAAEAARQAIREKYATLQAQMDAAQTPEQLKALLPEA